MLEKFFSYFAGESQCPFKPSDEAIFWDAEKTYSLTADKQFEEQLLNEADSLTEQLQATAKTDLQKKFLTYSREKKALAIYVQGILQKFCPMDGDSILINY